MRKIVSLILVGLFIFPLFCRSMAEEDYEKTITDVRSSVKPEEIYLQKKEIEADNLILYLRVRWNIHELRIKEEKKTRVEYAYIERKMKLNLGVETFDLTLGIENQILTHLTKNKDAIIDKAKKATFIEESLEIKKE